MKKLNLILISVLVYNFAFGGSVVTGKLGHRSMPCPGYPDVACPTIDVVKITNDTATFVLVKDGQMLYGTSQLGNYSEGDEISLYGNFYKGEDDYNTEEFYILDISHILNSSDNFTVYCKNNALDYGNQSTPPVFYVENDSLIVSYIKMDNCGAAYDLRISEVINDTLYMTFTDTSTMHATCDCNFDIRISAMKSVSENLKINYNGVFYSLSPGPSDIKQINIQNIQISNSAGKIKIRGIENYSDLTYVIYNSIGQTIQSGNLTQTINLSNVKGLYIFAIMQNKRVIAREKIIVK